MATRQRSRQRRRRGQQSESNGQAVERIAALRVERKLIADLQEAFHPRNDEVRNHPAPGSPRWNALKASLEHDYFDPIVLNERNGFLVSGHLRLKLLTEMGFTHVDVSMVNYDEPTHIARMLAANRGMGDDVFSGQKEFLQELEDCDGFNIELAGFTEEEKLTMFEWEPDNEDSENENGSGGPDDEGEEYTDEEVTALATEFMADTPTLFECERGQTWRVGDSYLYIGNILRDHDEYLPLLEMLKEEFDDRKVLFVPVPDPISLGTVDESIACLFVQPSHVAASESLSFVRRRSPEHPIELIEWEDEEEESE